MRMQDETVWLGLAGGYVSAGVPGAVDHYTTKVGGSAVFPGVPFPAANATGVGVQCQACQQLMPLVFQVRVCAACLALFCFCAHVRFQQRDSHSKHAGQTVQGWHSLLCPRW